MKTSACVLLAALMLACLSFAVAQGKLYTCVVHYINLCKPKFFIGNEYFQCYYDEDCTYRINATDPDTCCKAAFPRGGYKDPRASYCNVCPKRKPYITCAHITCNFL